MVHQEVVKPEKFPLGDVFPEIGGIESADQAVSHGQRVGNDGAPPLPYTRGSTSAGRSLVTVAFSSITA